MKLSRIIFIFAFTLVLSGAAGATDPFTIEWYRGTCALGPADQTAEAYQRTVYRNGICLGFFLGVAKMYSELSDEPVCEPNEKVDETIIRMLRQLQTIPRDRPLITFLHEFVGTEFSCE